jgi:hypothetical protein
MFRALPTYPETFGSFSDTKRKKHMRVMRISKKTPKKTRRKTAQEQNTNGQHAECDHVKKGREPKKAAKQNS